MAKHEISKDIALRPRHNETNTPNKLKANDVFDELMDIKSADYQPRHSERSENKAYDEIPDDEVECGKVYYVNKIVNGKWSKEGTRPWQVLLILDGYRCGGSILTKNHILTAAHCTEGLDPDKFHVFVGANYVPDNYEDGYWPRGYRVKKVYQHKNYNPDTFDNDIAILVLDESLTWSKKVVPACMPELDEEDPEDGTDCIVSGFGTVAEGGDLPDYLKETTVSIDDSCGKNSGITSNMICAGAPETDSCQGDSGGPLVCKSEWRRRYVQRGVVSFGRGCANQGYPGVYVRLSKYINNFWIFAHTDSDFYYTEFGPLARST